VLSVEIRTAILEMHARGCGKRAIARALGTSRRSVTRVLAAGSARRPALERAQKAEPHRDTILALYASCAGNLVRVHEELRVLGVAVSYPALTAYCRREAIGQQPKRAAGRYHFAPGQELQHDTSPHKVTIAGKHTTLQSAAATLAYSGMLFFQAYPRFRRFECKVLLTEAFRYFDGQPAHVMIDNTHVVVLRGTGAAMVPVPEMVAFAERFGFLFRAHEKGDVNRSARVERPFHFIEHNFFAGRSFADLADLNAQARQWCDRVNQRFVRSRRARPAELFASERAALRRLPVWVPDPYQLLLRTVDVEGYVSVDSNRYSVPEPWIGDQVEVRASIDRVVVDHRRHGTVEHHRCLLPADHRISLPEHHQRRQPRPTATSRELDAIATRAPGLLDYAKDLVRQGKKQPPLALRHLLRMIRDYPSAELAAAIAEAHHYGLFDLDRVETMALRRLATDFFRFDGENE